MNSDLLQQSVCIDFTNPHAFLNNYKFIADNCKAAVIGTTGWDDSREKILTYFTTRKKTLIYASNFSLGMNVYFLGIKIISKLLSKFDNYDPYLLEMHHREKKDAPSGTAKVITNLLEKAFDKKITPISIRNGWIKGIHEVGYESVADKIIVKHEAYSREGFAKGAVLAAELTDKTKGIWDFQDLLSIKFKGELK